MKQSLSSALAARFLAGVLILTTTVAPAQTATSFQLEMPKSHNPLGAYAPDKVPEPTLTNSPRLEQLIRDGKLYLSLKDAINLALENNLDLRQVLTESLLVSAAGGAAGVLLGYWGAEALVAFLTWNRTWFILPQMDVHPDMHVLIFTTLISTLVGLTFGLP